MSAPVNIYSAVVFDLPPKVKDYLDELDKYGQIDRDEHAQPYLLKVQKTGSNYQCFVIRDGKVHNFIINTRKKKEPVKTWDQNDGYARKDVAAQRVIQAPQGPKGERAKRTMESTGTWDRIVEQLMRD